MSTILLSGCSQTEAERYAEELAWCTMTWYIIFQSSLWNYFCMPNERVREIKFSECASDCDRAIDDNRDLSLNSADTWVVECLKLCMWEPE